MQSLEVEKQDAIAQQDIIRAESAQAQQDALAQQGDQFATEKSALEQQIAEFNSSSWPTASTCRGPPEVTMVEDGASVPDYMQKEFPYINLLGQEQPQEVKDMINNMPPATGEGGLPEGYSYKPGPGSEGFSYTTVMPSPGFRYAYGPDGDRIEVP